MYLLIKIRVGLASGENVNGSFCVEERELHPSHSMNGPKTVLQTNSTGNPCLSP